MEVKSGLKATNSMELKQKPNILIVDDIPENLFLFESILKPLDVNLILANSGLEAILNIEGHEIALALIDIRMPGMDGVELATIIQNDQKRELVPIIFITGQAQDEMELDYYYKSGAVDFILKPFRSNILLSKVKIFLELYRQKQQIRDNKEKLELTVKDLASSNKMVRESENLYRTLLNASPEGIIIMDTKGRITEISDIILELFGAKSKNEFIGVLFYQFIPAHELKKMKDILNRTRLEGLVQDIEFLLTRSNQSQFICELSTTLIQESDGRPKAFMAIIRDISQRKKVEQQLIRTERMVSLGEMAAAMAHEINQPLLSITLGIENMFAKIQQDCLTEDKYLRKKSESIFEDISRIGRIIDHVRAFSRDQDEYIATNFNINDSIENAVSLIHEQFKHHGIVLLVNLDKDIPSIVGNTYRFEQVILNFLTNAKDSFEDQKKKANSDFEKTIKVRTYHDEIANYVEIEDNGCGIKQEDIHRVMLPFFSTKRVGQGTGLGLSISFGIIKELDGNIKIESDLMIGTKFKITLPVLAKRLKSINNSTTYLNHE